MDVTSFESDQKTHDAVERCLEWISEAASKLGDMALYLMPDQPWHKIRAFDTIEQDRVFDIVRNDLPGLCTAVEEALRRWPSS